MKKEINLEGANKQFLDWTDSLNIIENKENKRILELGCGFGTQYLCNEFKEVYSFEVFDTKEWYDKSVQLLSKWDNWKGTFYTFEELRMWEDEKILRDTNGNIRNYRSLLTFYETLNDFVDLDTIDVVFVDQSFHHRAETVLYFMNKEIKNIFAHDTKHGSNMYGWNIIQPNEKYKVVNFDSHQGVTHWIKYDS